MKRDVLRLISAGSLVLAIGCASGARPIQQLEPMTAMVGGTLNGPGVEFDPEITAWLRFAPFSYFDLTIGGTFTVPLFENAAYGALGEVRVHIPTGPYMRVVLDGSAEVLRYKLTERTSLTVSRLTFSPLLAYDATDITPYLGPKIMYLSHMDSDGLFGNTEPGLRADGDGIVFLGGIIGIEDEVDGWVLGGTVDLGILMNARDINKGEGVGGTIAFYVGY